MKTNTTLRIGRIQYRQLAEQTKQVGCCLELKTFEELGGAWGMFCPFASPVHPDVSKDDKGMHERIVIQLATTVNTGAMRGVQRPEIDWSQLHDDEIYKFIVAHEIGHFMDNHCVFDIWNIADRDIQEQCRRVFGTVNEVLADRYAWNQIRPGEPVPLCEKGKRLEEQVAQWMALLDQHAPRTRRAARALPGGQYAWVPRSMLETAKMTEFVGPHVSPALIERVRERRRVHRRDSRLRA